MASVHSDGDASLLAHRSFVAFWLARTCSGFGFQMLSIVVGWQIYALTHSAFYLGLIGLVQFLPSVTLALWAGHIADQRDRRRVVLIGQLVEWLAIGALAAATVAHLADVKIILGLIFIISVAKVMEAPSLQSMLPALVPPALLARATAASAVSSQAAMIMGPALGACCMSSARRWCTRSPPCCT